MYVRSQKFVYFGHWLSDVNTHEKKTFDTHLVFICNTFNHKAKISTKPQFACSKFWGLSGSEDKGGGDNSIQFINFGRVGDKSLKEWRQKIGGWKGGWQQYLDFFVLLY